MPQENLQRLTIPFEEVKLYQIWKREPADPLECPVFHLAGETRHPKIENAERAIPFGPAPAVRVHPFLPVYLLSDLRPDIKLFAQFTPQGLFRCLAGLQFPPGKLPFERVCRILAALTGKNLVFPEKYADSHFLHAHNIRKNRKKWKFGGQRPIFFSERVVLSRLLLWKAAICDNDFIHAMEIKELLVGEYTGTIAPRIAGSVHILRNRTRIFESDKGHLAYVITEHSTERIKRISRRETYVGLVTGEAAVLRSDAELIRIHLSPLDKPYRGDRGVQCHFKYQKEYESYFLVFQWMEDTAEIQFPLKKNGGSRIWNSGRRV